MSVKYTKNIIQRYCGVNAPESSLYLTDNLHKGAHYHNLPALIISKAEQKWLASVKSCLCYKQHLFITPVGALLNSISATSDFVNGWLKQYFVVRKYLPAHTG